MKRLLLALAVCTPLAAAASEVEVKLFPAAALERMEIYAETGAINVKTSTGTQVRVEITDNDPRKCAITSKVDGKKLVLRAEQIKKSRFFSSSGDNCKAAFTVYAPAALPVSAESGAGALDVSGRSGETSLKSGVGSVSVHAVSGGLDIKTGVGSVTGDACGGNLRIDAETGSVDLTGLCGPLRVETGVGTVALEWKKAPEKGEVRVKTETGKISLTFPAGTSLSANLKTGVGSIKNEFKDKGGLSVYAKSGVGSISVVKADK